MVEPATFDCRPVVAADLQPPVEARSGWGQESFPNPPGRILPRRDRTGRQMSAAFRCDHKEMTSMAPVRDEFDLDIRLATPRSDIPDIACSDTEMTVGRPCISINASCRPWCDTTNDCG
jgi:hypothetical protein